MGFAGETLSTSQLLLPEVVMTGLGLAKIMLEVLRAVPKFHPHPVIRLLLDAVIVTEPALVVGLTVWACFFLFC